jgi:hypothetical protein
MKTLKPFLMLVIGMVMSMAFAYKHYAEENEASLLAAIKAGKISCIMENNPGYSHYSKCLLMKLQNKTSQVVQIELPAGLQVSPTDSSYQNLVLTETQFVSLQPSESKKIALFAMCTEPNDHAPGESTVRYQLKNHHSPKLTELCKFLFANAYFTSEGQAAVWAVAANRPIEDISGFDTSAVRKLQMLTAKLTNRKVPPPPAKNDYRRNYYAPPQVMKVVVTGSHSFKFSKTRSVQIAMFNTHNVLVRELYNNPREPAGSKTIPYKFDASIYTDSVYFMRMIVDGANRMETKMTM